MKYDFVCLQVSQIVRLTGYNISHCNDIFARSESNFPQDSREKNCETRLAVNPTFNLIHKLKCRPLCLRHRKSVQRFVIVKTVVWNIVVFSFLPELSVYYHFKKKFLTKEKK
jgi:hypothetical protein